MYLTINKRETQNSLEDFISMQNEELAAQRQEIESLRNDKQNIEQHYQVPTYCLFQNQNILKFFDSFESVFWKYFFFTQHWTSWIDFELQGQLQELKKTMVADVQRMQDEVKRHFAQQKCENSRLTQQITTLKGEKTSLQQQILGLQRRIQEIEEQIGSD